MSSRRTAPRGKTAKQESSSAAIVASAVAALVAVAAILFFVSRDSDGGGGSDSTATPAGMAHVHGLAIDPADGALLAGTHYGAFRVGEDGEIEQFGPVQDFMGFSVAGPGHYVASGHPGAGQDGPGNLGLIESTDGGKTWNTVSLEGKADFHTLKARHGRVYGSTGGQLMVSEDKRNWEQRASIPIADLAVSPDDPDTLIVTTQQGLGISTDGGRQFQALPGTPALFLLSWSEDGTLVGVDPNGTLHVSDDDGKTWSERGNAGGQPAALTATDDEIFVATRDGQVVESSDGGNTFQIRYREA
jgi:photosystem II stability/assembly factor-like uncharacterized protein